MNKGEAIPNPEYEKAPFRILWPDYTEINIGPPPVEYIFTGKLDSNGFPIMYKKENKNELSSKPPLMS